MSMPRWVSWPLPASNPERGNSTPTFSGPPCARTTAGAASTTVVAAAPATKRRRSSDPRLRPIQIRPVPIRLMAISSPPRVAEAPDKSMSGAALIRRHRPYRLAVCHLFRRDSDQLAAAVLDAAADDLVVLALGI